MRKAEFIKIGILFIIFCLMVSILLVGFKSREDKQPVETVIEEVEPATVTEYKIVNTIEYRYVYLDKTEEETTEEVTEAVTEKTTVESVTTEAPAQEAPVTEAPTETPTEAPAAEGDMTFYSQMEMTAYIETGYCCADGVYPQVGYTIACNDPNLWHKWIYIEGYGTRYVHDTGGMANNVIDLYVGDYDSAIQIGRQYVNVYILN